MLHTTDLGIIYRIALVSLHFSFTVALIFCDRVVDLGVVFGTVISTSSYSVCRVAAHTLGFRLSVNARICGSSGNFCAPGKEGAVVIEVRDRGPPRQGDRFDFFSGW